MCSPLLLASCLFTLSFYTKVRLQHFEVNVNLKTEITSEGKQITLLNQMCSVFSENLAVTH